jgi:tetratricopeptide (TPR) repeat protein
VADGWPGAHELAPKAKAAARKAIELDETLADPHAALALVLSQYDWDWRGAELEFRRAIALNPDSSTAHHWLGTHLLRLLRFQEALQELRTAQSLDPLSLMVSTNLAGAYFAIERYDEAIERLRTVLELDPNFLAAHLILGVALAGQGRYEDALAEFRKTSAQASDTDALYFNAYIDALSGNEHEARRLLRQLEDRSTEKPGLTYDVAGLHAVLGDKDRAFELLDRAWDDRSRLAEVQLDTRFAKFHDDPRYRALLRKIGYPE